MKKDSNVIKVISGFLLFILCLPSAALGKTPPSGPGKVVIMEEVVVTATKTPERRKDVPHAVVIMDKNDLQASGARTIGELLANEPGIDWKTYGNYGGASQEIHIRGMRGKATQVLVNGVSVNSPSLGVADVGKIPLDNIEKIEVVKGPGSLLYGSGAMGGTVNIITKNPRKGKKELSVGAGCGSQNTYRLALEQGMFVTRDLGYYLTAGRTETDGFRDNSHLMQTAASLKLVWDPEDVFNISLYGDYLDRTYGMPNVRPPAGTRDYAIGGIKFYNDQAASLLDKSNDQDGRVVLKIKGAPSAWFDYNFQGYYTVMDNYNYERYAFDGSGSENWVTNRVWGTDGHLNLYPFAGAKLLLGGEYKDFNWQNEVFDLNTSGVRTARTTSKASLFSKGVFVEGEWRPLPYAKVLAGFRHETHSAFGSENLPLFGLVINPTETMALKVNHGKHFLAPTPNDLYWPVGPYTRGNANLKPEIGWHTDVTWEQSWLDDKLFLTLSYFKWHVDDKIQWEPDSQGVWNPINLAGYRAEGIEAGIKIGPFYSWTLALNYTVTEAKEENREYSKQDYGWPPFFPPDFQYHLVTRRAAMTPEHLFKGELSYRSNFGLTATATARYTGNRITYRTESTVYPGTRTVPYTLNAYWTADLKITQRLFKQWVFSLSGNNLFDEKYDTHLSRFTDQTTFKTTAAGYPGAGRSVFAELKYEF